VRFSTHYYVLSLGMTRSALFEAFRDSLIDVENQGFPVTAPGREPDGPDDAHTLALARTIDGYFGHYFAHEPLGLVVVGDSRMQAAFDAVTLHRAAIVGRLEGDHTVTSARDLGRIVWQQAKESMSGVLDRAMRDLDEFTGRGLTASGIDAVVRAAGGETNATLLVEDDYHLRGSISRRDGEVSWSPEVDVRSAIDDAVDAVIEQVLESAGHVVFTPPGALRDQEQIVLLLGGGTAS